MMNSRQRIVQARFLDNEERVIKRLNQVYNRCWSDTTALYERLSDDVKGLTGVIKLLDKDDPQRAVLQSRLQAKIYQRDFQRQLDKQLEGIVDNMFLSEYKTVSDYLTGCYDEGFIGTLYDLHGQGVPFSIPINQQAVVHAVQLDSKISEGLYTRLGENTKLLKQKIMAQTSRMMVLGTSYAEASKQLSNYTNIGFNRSVRIMRTEGHRIQCQASMDALTDVKEMGADVVKQWDATLDGKTRPTHIMVDGEIRELEEPFSNGLMFAGDPNGEAREVINCRCALLNRARWGLEDGFTKYDSFEDRLVTFDSPEHYDHFKQWYFSDDNKKYMQFVQNLEDKYETRNFADILGRMTGKEYDTFKKLEANRPKYTPMTKVANTPPQGTLTKIDNPQRARRRPPKRDTMENNNVRPFDVRSTTTKLKATMDDAEYNEFMRMLDDNDLIKPLYKHADDLRRIEFNYGGAYNPSDNSLTYDFPNISKIKDGQHKFRTLSHEYGHYVDRLGVVDDLITHDEYDGLLKAINATDNGSKISRSDQFLSALRKDEVLLKNKLDEIQELIWDNPNIRTGLQDAMDGLELGNVLWGHGNQYYNRLYKGAIDDRGLVRQARMFYRTLGLNAGGKNLKHMVRQYETASELWANLISALTTGGQDLEAFQKYMPNSLEMCKKLVRGIL